MLDDSPVSLGYVKVQRVVHRSVLQEIVNVHELFLSLDVDLGQYRMFCRHALGSYV